MDTEVAVGLLALGGTTVTVLGGIAVAVIGNKKIGAISADVQAARADAAVTRQQTENEHADAEFPNLRDELTATREGNARVGQAVDALSEVLSDVRHSLRRHDREIGGIRDDFRRMQDWLGGEQVERRHLANALAAHMPHAERRDHLISEVQSALRLVQDSLVSIASEVHQHHEAPPSGEPGGA